MRGSHRSSAFCVVLLVTVLACEAAETPPPGDARASAAPARDTAADRAAIEAAVNAHWTAIRNGDTVAIANAHTGDMTFFGPESRERIAFGITSPASDALWKKFRGAKASWSPRDVQIRVNGDIGVATFYNEGSTTYPDGKVDRETRKVTEVWTRQTDGSWKESHHHDSRVSQ